MLPPAAPLTSQLMVTLELVVVLLERFTTAVNVVVVFRGTVMLVGEIVTEVMVVEPLPLPPPQLALMQIAESTRATSASEENFPRGWFPFGLGMGLLTDVLKALTRITYTSPSMRPVGGFPYLRNWFHPF